MDIKLSIAHLNHGLRTEAGGEEAFVSEQASALGLPCFVRKQDVRELAQNGHWSLEEAGRIARYEFFRELARAQTFNSIATGHQQGDVAETVLHHLLRGSGMRGLRGIMPANEGIIRPILCLDRSEILEYLTGQNIPYCRDLSNEDQLFTRNRIRHHLIPQLEEHYNPSIIAALNQLASIMREENAFMDRLAQTQLQELLVEEKKSGLVLDAAGLNALPLAMKRRLLLQALERIGGREKWSMSDVQDLGRLLGKTGSSSGIDLKKGFRAVMEYGQLRIGRISDASPAFNHPVQVPGEVMASSTGFRYSFEVVDRETYNPVAGDFLLDWERMESSLVLRSRQPGDRFTPDGMKGSKKVKDYFIDCKIPVRERDRAVILSSIQGRIWAIVGYRADAAAAPGPCTRHLLLIRREWIHGSED